MRRLLLALAALVLLAGCSEEGDSDPEPLPPPVQRGGEYEKRVIRGWLLALNRDDYTGAADYFAVGASSTRATRSVCQAPRPHASSTRGCRAGRIWRE
jgi:hypothetical protein